MKKYYKNHLKISKISKKQKQAHKLTAKALLRKYRDFSGPMLIAVGGPGGTGKTTFAAKLAKELGSAGVLCLDDYKASRAFRSGKNIFGAHPEANNMDLLRVHLNDLKKGKPIQKPVYCRKKGEAREQEDFVPQRFVIAEGEIATYREFHDLIDFSIFIDSHWKTQLNTRIQRDIEERGYTPQKAIAAFLYSNLHEFCEYGAQSKHWADIHIHCDQKYRLVIDAVCAKSAEFFVEDASNVLADVLLAQTGSPKVRSVNKEKQ